LHWSVGADWANRYAGGDRCRDVVGQQVFPGRPGLDSADGCDLCLDAISAHETFVGRADVAGNPKSRESIDDMRWDYKPRINNRQARSTDSSQPILLHSILASIGLLFVGGCGERPHKGDAQIVRADERDDILLPVRAGELYGYIRRDGSFAIPPQFTAAGEMGSAPTVASIGGHSAGFPVFGDEFVFRTGGTGYIDKKGKWVINPIYAGAQPFAGSAVAAVSRSWRLDAPGMCDEWALLDRTGAETPLPETIIWVYQFGRDGLARVRARDDGSSERYGFISESGGWAVPPRFEWASDMSNGHALVRRKCSYAVINAIGELRSWRPSRPHSL
jgi:hypothetical protein